MLRHLGAVFVALRLPNPRRLAQLASMTTNERLRQIRSYAALAVVSGLLWLSVAACSATPGPDSGAAPSPEPGAAESAPPAIPTFTEAQVADGQAAFSASCSECHSTREFRGSDFQFRFRRRTAWNFYTLVTETMPEDAPGSLDPATYVAIVSYVLQLNGYEAGDTALEPTEDALSQLPLDGVPTGTEGF